MKKLGLAVAMVLGMASAAQAQTTQQVINATANIAQVLTLSAVDSTFECGTVNYASTTCPDLSTATVKVEANSNWTLTMADDTSTNANLVRMTNVGPRPGSFDIALAWNDAATEANCVGATCAGIATPLGGVNVDIVDNAASINIGSLLSLSSLATDDENGNYTGSFTATLAAAP